MAEILKQVTDTPQADITAALNQLIKSQALATLQTQDGQLLFRLQTQSEQLSRQNEAAKLSGLVAEDRLVLQEIEKSGADAISTKDLRFKSGNLPQPTLTKILKKLEVRQLIKSVKSVHAGNVKKYMLFDLAPSKEITGGPWYSEGEFDYEFIATLKKLAEQYLRKEYEMTSEGFHVFIRDSGIISGAQQLRQEHTEAVLQSLVYDARLQAIIGRDEPTYRLSPKLASVDELVKPILAVPQCGCLTCNGVAPGARPGSIVPSGPGPSTDSSVERYIPCRNMTAWLEKAADAVCGGRR